MKEALNRRIAYLLTVGIIIKLLVDTSFQIFNPFLTIIAAGTGISAASLGGLVGARSLLGLGAPLIGTVSDRFGYRKIMQISLILSGTGLLIAGMSVSPLVFGAGILMTGLGQAGFTPSIHAHTSSRLPYNKRAMGIGILEYSWALAGMIGLLAAGILIEEFSWRTPFTVLGVALLLSALLLFSLPESEATPGTERRGKKVSLSGRLWHLGENSGSAWGTVLVHGFAMFSSMHLMIIHGGWLVDRFGLSPSLLGTIALILGCTDLSASVTVSLIVDKVGKKKSVAIGLAGMVLGFLMLPFFNVTVVTAVIGLIIPRTFFEFAIVSNIALLSEQVPEQRGKILSMGSAAGLIGITAASSLGPLNYFKLGLSGLSYISLGTSAAALLILIFMVRENRVLASIGEN